MRYLLALLLALLATPATAADWPVREADFTLRDFRFRSGETLPELRIHYATLGTPNRGAGGRIDNAVLLLHGTGGSGKATFLAPPFADELYGPGAPLDLATTYIILPDSIGHGGSSRPSDGLRMAFPRYDYDDMVEAQRRLLVEGLGVARLRLILGTSMGCMHTFTWGVNFPGFAERLAPLACYPVEVAGRNRIQRKMAIDAIKADPAWNGGNYTSPPLAGLRTAAYISILMGGNVQAMQAEMPTRESADAALDRIMAARQPFADANDTLYWTDASRTYNPAPRLDRITVPLLWVNSADDGINPPELGIGEREVGRMPRARFVLIPASAQTRGHGTFLWAKYWKADLAKLLATP